MADGNGQILDLNGRRKPHNRDADFCTKAEATAIADKVCQFYMNQVPGLVEQMLAAAGIALPPPPPPVEAPQEPT